MERAELNRFLAGLGCAERHGGFTFLRDPHWSPAEAATAMAQMSEADALADPRNGWLCIRTGGSAGGVKFARHDQATLTAAVEGFCGYFELRRVNTVGVLPAWHVSGLMARLRCFATQGTYVDAAWKEIEAGRFPAVPDAETVLSLVPTQLHRLLNTGAGKEWLRRFRIVFLGGGPTWPELADAAARAGVRVSLSYGMTETAAMVVAQRSEDFAAGDRSCGRAMPHARVTIDDEGRIVVAGTSLFRGYFGGAAGASEFTTPDFGQIDATGRLRVLGRVDGAIVTGGKKANAGEIEAALRASGEFEDVAVVGVPDAEWGEIVVACYPESQRTPDPARAVTALAAHQRPKRFVPIRDWPRNAQGKINRAELIRRLP